MLELRDIDPRDLARRGARPHLRRGVDRGVWHLMAGLPYPIWLAGYGFRASRNPVPGADVAGVVEYATAVTSGRDSVSW